MELIKGKELEHINLKGSGVEDKYKGAGAAYVVVVDGEAVDLFYENTEFPAISIELSDEEWIELMIDNGVNLPLLENMGGDLLYGMCSSYQLVHPVSILRGKLR